jgi:hypothetical protein
MMDGFYGGRHSFHIQPYGAGRGHFDLRDILKKAGQTVNQMTQEAENIQSKEPLYMNIEFWYNPLGMGQITRNPNQPHYFDFKRSVLVADF